MLTPSTLSAPDLIQPYNYRSTLELLTPGSWQAIHGCVLLLRKPADLVLMMPLRRFEFRPNEFISTVKSVSLATQSTASGRKDFIAVGTTVYRAEDLAARGGVRSPLSSSRAILMGPPSADLRLRSRQDRTGSRIADA